jgi:hypothetical protein
LPQIHQLKQKSWYKHMMHERLAAVPLCPVALAA